MDNNNLDIFICSHKDFEPVVTNPVYKVVDSRNIDKSKYPLEDDFFSEFLAYFYVADNYELKDYVGFCHYRRYFSFMDDIPDIDELFKTYDAAVIVPFKFNGTTREQYEHHHNIEDLEIVENIINEKYPEYSSAMNSFLNGNVMLPNNIFIMKKNDFLEYVEFIRGVLNEYLKIVGVDIRKRLKKNKKNYIKKIDNLPMNSTLDYQYRIGGFIGERLTNIFIFKKFNRVKAFDMNITENKSEDKTEKNG